MPTDRVHRHPQQAQPRKPSKQRRTTAPLVPINAQSPVLRALREHALDDARQAGGGVAVTTKREEQTRVDGGIVTRHTSWGP